MWAERLIAEAIERGELDPHEGLGDPILDLDDDPNWWVKKWVEREKLSASPDARGSRGGKDRGTLVIGSEQRVPEPVTRYKL
jgi:hypothetical protein